MRREKKKIEISGSTWFHSREMTNTIDTFWQKLIKWECREHEQSKHVIMAADIQRMLDRELSFEELSLSILEEKHLLGRLLTN